MNKKEKGKDKPKMHDELDGFQISINEFGQITSSFEVDKLNDFLNEHVADKKLYDSEEE